MQLPSTKVVTIPEFVTATFIARLARAIVMELQPLDRILDEFKLTQDQYAVVKLIPYFKRVCEEFAAEWNRITSTQDRLRLISAVMLEEGLPRLGSQMVDPNIGAAVAVETGKFFAKIAGVGDGPKTSEAAGGDRFTITINMGQDAKVEIAKDVTPRTAKEVEEPTPLSELPERSADDKPLEADPERESLEISSEPFPNRNESEEEV
jgi:hypothetical protein